MIRSVIDDKRFKIVFGLLVGLPATCMYIVVMPYGVAFIMATIKEPNHILILFSLATVLGSIGVMGAWFRLCKKSQNFSALQIKITKIALACGIAAVGVLIGLSTTADEFLGIAGSLSLILVTGVLFYVGT